ncbi:Ribokinase-like protein [Polychytrium aggregatum]|uniref:Ribokinase-like protein n=1 Tax=Polychytrium aggregatum TaxID=110093 RepID=UPI0022FE4330|nr:Ribokinase-like protein [Polychytrium aggregatum]KAI9209903.1 Ribokinase-like protein [Polychytrium aggregatum]
MPRQVSIFMYGALFKDIILGVDRFPAEDSKLAARTVQTRRGGNTGNSLVVMSQYLGESDIHGQRVDVDLNMIGCYAGTPESQAADVMVTDLTSRSISISSCIFRGPEFTDPTSWIIATPSTRTIVNHNTMPELSSAEFEAHVLPNIVSASGEIWAHFEGRNCLELSRMIARLDQWRTSQPDRRIRISVEFEKPRRLGMEALLKQCDVAIFSAVYAADYGYDADHHDEFLRWIRPQCLPGCIQVITNGDRGATLAQGPTDRHGECLLTHIPAGKVYGDAGVVDTIGAGDSFIGGYILGMAALQMDPRPACEFGCRVASAKCGLVGFDGVALLVKP